MLSLQTATPAPAPAPRYRYAPLPPMSDTDRLERMLTALEAGDLDEVERLDPEAEDEETEAAGYPSA